MESKDILLSIGRFEAKIDSLEKSVAKLENCVSKMAETMADNKGGWRLVMMLVSTVLVALFGQSPADLGRLSMAAAAASFCTNSVIVGFYALMAQSFPTPLRGSGTGFVIGVGRLGAAAGRA